jgi:hypothetical protein
LRTGLALAGAAIALAGCGGDSDGSPAADAEPPPPQGKPWNDAKTPPPPRDPAVRPPPCPPDLSNCKVAYGRIVYVERVDPDGDGDAHFVLASRQSITAPDISVIDVGAALRPHPLPGIGDQLAAAGPVYPGSYGQRQIEAVAINVAASG